MDTHVFDPIVINPEFLESLNNDTYYYIEELVNKINANYSDNLKSVIDGNKYRSLYETQQYNIKYEKDEEMRRLKLEEIKRDKRRKEKKKLRKEKEKKEAEKYEKKYKNRKNRMKVKDKKDTTDIEIDRTIISVMNDIVTKVIDRSL